MVIKSFFVANNKVEIMDLENKLAEIIIKNLRITDGSAEALSRENIAGTIKERCGSPILPGPRESLAVSVMTPKTAALAFDRVYRNPLIIDNPVPEIVGFYFATPPEIAWNAILLAGVVAYDMGLDFSDFDLSNVFKEDSGGSVSAEKESLHFICSQFPRRPTFFYNSQGTLCADFPTGRSEVLQAAMKEIALVREDELEWEQVLEFRKDAQARVKYRRFVRWIDTELKTASPDEVVEIMSVRLDDYEWALKKHGLQTFLGSLSCLLDLKFLTATSATIATSAVVGGSMLASLTGTSVIIGRSVLEFGTRLIDAHDSLRKENYELAYLHDVRKMQ